MKCVVLYNSCDKERFENILKWNALSYCEFWGICCDDYSGVNEIVKKKDEITKAVHESDFIMVIAGEHGYDSYPCLDGFRNWISFAIAENASCRKKLVVVKLQLSSPVPMEAYGIGAVWVHTLSEDSLNRVFKNLISDDLGFKDWKSQLRGEWQATDYTPAKAYFR